MFRSGMDENYCNKQTFASIVKTILLFLENNNLQETACAFTKEIEKKLKHVNLSEIPPRTVILRPMDIKTNVDATISDENLIICISGKNIDVNSAGFDKKKVIPDGHAIPDAELLPNVKELIDHDDHKSPDREKRQEDTYFVPCSSTVPNAAAKSINDARFSHIANHNLVNISREEIETQEVDITIPSSNTSTQDEGSGKLTSPEKLPEEEISAGGTEECVAVEEMNQTSSIHMADSMNQSKHIDLSNVCPTTKESKGNYKHTSPKRYQPKHVSPNRKVPIGHNKPAITKSPYKSPKLYTEIDSCPTPPLQPVKCKASLSPSSKRPRAQSTASTASTSPPKVRAPTPVRQAQKVSEAPKEKVEESPKKDYNIPPEPKDICISAALSAKPHSSCQLDYAKIKYDLLHGSDEVKLKLMQALRWRLTRSDTKIRDHNLVCYITHDLLQLDSGADFFEKFLGNAQGCESVKLQEEASRFTNTLASMSMGREYLEKCSSLVQIILPILMRNNKSNNISFQNVTRQFIMATVQKLSLGGRIRKMMIHEGIVQWLLKYIRENHELMTDYEAEYSIALFSNLCIHKDMRELCETIPDETAKLLSVLVYTPHKCCLPYLSGILGSLLTIDTINKKAAELNIEAKLKYLVQCADDEEAKQQLEFIIQLHGSKSQNKCMYDVVEEPQVYSDYLECELGMHELDLDNPVGEKFLEKYCSTLPTLEKHVHVVKRSCSYGVNKGHSDCGEGRRSQEEPMNMEVSSSPSAPILNLCRLNDYNLNRPITIPVQYSSIMKGKYSCECYDEIKNVLSEDTNTTKNPQNSGRKPNNVVYGPLITPKNYCTTLNIFPCSVKQCCG